MRASLHFCTDRTAWRHILPAVLYVHESSFSWELCRHPQGLMWAQQELIASTVSFVPPGCEQFVEQWISIYGHAFYEKFEVCWWGLNPFRPESIELPRLSAEDNGTILHWKSVYPNLYLRQFSVTRGIDKRARIKVQRILDKSAAIIEGFMPGTATLNGLNVPSMPATTSFLDNNYA